MPGVKAFENINKASFLALVDGSNTGFHRRENKE
jgi:hypothetical protein